MKAKHIPRNLLLACGLKSCAYANLVGIIVVGGAAIFVVWVGAKVISRVISLFDKEEQQAEEFAAVRVPTSPTPGQGQTSLSSPLNGGIAGGQQEPVVFGPEREHNQDHRLSISQWSPGVIGVYVPTYTALDWSLDGVSWTPWKTNTGPDEIELFDASLHPQMFFRGRGIQSWIYK